MTPLSFLFWASWELAFGLGLPGMRLSSTVLSAATLLLIGWRARTPGHRALLACIGLMLFPYWVGLSIVMYTDMVTTFLVVLGFVFYARGHGVASAVAFSLAIAARQYAVTYPASLVAAELVPFLLGRGRWHPERVLPMAAAAGTLLGWVLFFGGLGPQQGLDAYPTHMESLANVTPFHGLYFLSCIGAYFVVPEFVLFRRWREPWRPLFARRNLVIAAVVFALFLVFQPPQHLGMGPLKRVTVTLFPFDVLGPVSIAVQILLFATLAWLACVRFARIDLLFWLLLSRVVLMATAWEGWEKYNTALIAALWYLRSISDLSGPIALWRLESDRPEPEAPPAAAGGPAVASAR